MSLHRPLRLMWLLDHSMAGEFELPMLKSVGVQEIFVPKCFRDHPSFRSASVDWSPDAGLTIPAHDLAIMNAADWRGEPDGAAWALANQHFGALFFALHTPQLLASIGKNFQGVALWRAYGLAGLATYSEMLATAFPAAKAHLRRLGPRLLWTPAYAHLGEVEEEEVRRREICLPLGIPSATAEQLWTGTDSRVLLVCPSVSGSASGGQRHQRLIDDFRYLPHAVAGMSVQSARACSVPAVATDAEVTRALRSMRVMFYGGGDRYCLDGHPLRAIGAGMPLIFMGGGLLDRLGGIRLPGRAVSIGEARAKIERILDGDQSFTNEVRSAQMQLREVLHPDRLTGAWRDGLQQIKQELSRSRRRRAYLTSPPRAPRIAVLLSHEYRGGVLRASKLVAEALAHGARATGKAADIVFGHIDNPAIYADDDFADLAPQIARRPFRWRQASAAVAARAATYAGASLDVPGACQFPDDGINQFLDCDLWVLVSDRIPLPLLALRPYIVLAYDYLQRHESILSSDSNAAFIDAARRAARVWVTTAGAREDAIQFAGIAKERVIQLPMLAPRFPAPPQSSAPPARPYFLWPTNAAPHKNHANALLALRRYYHELDGQLDCRIVGPGTERIASLHDNELTQDRPEQATSRPQPARVRVDGEVSDGQYRALLAAANFLWHPTRRDNGTFCVVEAASLGVPSLSSDYPAMREMDSAFALALAWMDPTQPADMARKLKRTEDEAGDRRRLLPDRERLARASLETAAPSYWEAACACL